MTSIPLQFYGSQTGTDQVQGRLQGSCESYNPLLTQGRYTQAHMGRQMPFISSKAHLDTGGMVPIYL